MKTAIIIEDELDAQELLQSIIEEYCLDLKVIGVASNKAEGRDLIMAQCPDIVFLDIQLGADIGFHILEEIEDCSFKLIVTTAFKDYALEAFEHEALAYVVKPYSPKSIISAINKALKIIDQNAIYSKLDTLMDNKGQSKISLPTKDGYVVLNIQDVVNVEADRSYCDVHLESGKKIIVSKPLKELEAMLTNDFFRTHVSHIINLKRLTKYNKEDGGVAVMTNDKCIPISRRKKAQFVNILKSGTFKNV